MPPCRVIYLLEGISDHCPAKISLTAEKDRAKRSFQYCNVWDQHPLFLERVKAGWEVQIQGCKILQVVKKLKMMKRGLKQLNSQYFENIVGEVDEDRTIPPTAKQGKLDKGDWQSDPDVIAKNFVNYYVELLGQNSPTRVKAREGFIKMGPNDSSKSPGPDSFGSGFFKAVWSIIGEDITAAILEFFHNGKLLKQLNSTNIALIPNVEDPEYASQYRPISCCNIVYKGISKMLCSRLTHAVSQLEADNQATFIPGRSMMHNVLICHDLLRHYNRKTSARCLMNIDLRKAYDLVEWKFLEEVLKGFGFPEKFLQLIMTCVKSTKFSIKINGEDDLMILCKGNIALVTRVMEALPHFSKASGLIANLKKSNIFIARVDEVTKDFHITQSVVKEADKICREYKWGSSEEKKKVFLVSWEKICFPKKYGELNVKGSRLWNVASVGKLLWQLIDKQDSLWVKWVHGIYMKTNTSIWNHKPPLDSSWYRRKLNSLKDEMKAWYERDHYSLIFGGVYSITRSYTTLLGDMPRLNIADLIWSAIAQLKHRFFMWLGAQGRLLTKDRLRKLHIQVEDGSCCLCDAGAEEEPNHLFVACSLFTILRGAVTVWAGVQIQEGDIRKTLERIKRKNWKQTKKEIVAAIFGSMFYHTWRARN
ncbi:uncharacterized protein [Nicotiana tomentosiformis]|uniref:uncharacterized protein n=1 Tax=Nicotiana tomentosiformis TaxID=4098 RepID=UPI00388C79F0